MTAWLTIERRNGARSTRFTVTSEEWDSTSVKRGTARAATDEEISAAVQRRDERAKDEQIEQTFKARADYQDAQAIAAILEWLSPTNQVLDKLTPDEWSNLRQRLSK